MVGNCVLIFYGFLPALDFHLQCYRLRCFAFARLNGMFQHTEPVPSRWRFPCEFHCDIPFCRCPYYKCPCFGLPEQGSENQRELLLHSVFDRERPKRDDDNWEPHLVNHQMLHLKPLFHFTYTEARQHPGNLDITSDVVLSCCCCCCRCCCCCCPSAGAERNCSHLGSRPLWLKGWSEILCGQLGLAHLVCL